MPSMPAIPILFAAVTFDPSINLGTVLQIVAFLVAIVGSYYAIKGKVDNISNLLSRDREDDQGRDSRIEKLEGVVNVLAQTTQRIVGNIEARDKLEFGPANERRSRGRT